MFTILNGHLVDPANNLDGLYDITIENGCIASVVPAGTSSCNGETMDAAGLYVFPGFIDTHSHFRDPGFPAKEDIGSGARAALYGGYTSCIMMGNTKPSIDCPEVLAEVLEKGKQTPIHVYSCANVTKGMNGEELADLKALKEAGAVGFTDDGKPIMDENLLKEALVIAASLKMPVSLHEEDPQYIKEAGVNAGASAAALGLTGADRLAESTMAERDIRLALETGCHLVIQHVSAKETVAMLTDAAASDGARLIHGEATPHHFSLTDAIILEKGTAAKCNPPIRTEEDRLAIIDALKSGALDLIATDHAPHTAEEKAQPFTKAPSGMIGLETAFPLALKNLVQTGALTLSEVITRMSTAPAELYHLRAGSLAVGMPADIVLWNLEGAHTFDHFESRACNSPFLGETLPGELVAVFVDGKRAL